MSNEEDYVLINNEKNGYKIYNIKEKIDYNQNILSLYNNIDYYSQFNYYYTEIINTIKDVVISIYNNNNSFTNESLFNMVSSL